MHMASLDDMEEDADPVEDAAAGPMQAPVSGRSLLHMLSPEGIELVGNNLHTVPLVGAFNHAMAMRQYDATYPRHLARQPASAVTMLNASLLRGMRFDNTNMQFNRTRDSDDDDDDDDDQTTGHDACGLHVHDALLFQTMYTICTQNTPCHRARRLISEMVRMYPLALVSRNNAGNTPLHELLKQPEWWDKIEPRDLLAAKDSTMRSEDGFEQRLCQNAKYNNTVLMLALKHLFKVDTDIGRFIDRQCHVLLLANRQRRLPLHLLFMNNGINLELQHVEMLSHMPVCAGSAKSDEILLHRAHRGSMALHTAILVVAGVNEENWNSMEGLERLRGMMPQIVPMLVDSTGAVLKARYEHVVTCAIDDIEREVTDTPLHMALRHSMSWDVCKQLRGSGEELLFAHTGCDERGYDEGNLPLHLAVMGQQRMICVTGLIDDAGVVVRTQNHRGDYPLHMLLRRNHPLTRGRHAKKFNVAVALHLVKVGLAGDAGFLLLHGRGDDQVLHIAAMYKAPEVVVHAIVTADPRALLVAKGRNMDHNERMEGMLPIHLAVHRSTEPDVGIIRLLVDDAMTVLTTTTLDGRVPLQVAVAKGVFSTAVIKLLLSGATDPPVVVCTADGKDLRLWGDGVHGRPNNTALHIALVTGASIDVLRLLIDPLGRVLCEENMDGNTPLHIAAQKHVSLEIMQLLIEAQRPNARALDVRLRINSDGNTPLHLALQSTCDTEKLLLLMDPEKCTLSIRNKNGHCPLHVFVKTQAIGMNLTSTAIDDKTCEMLWTMMPALEVDMPAIDVLRCGDNEGNTPLHLVLAHQIVCTESSLCFLIGKHKDLLRQQNLLGETPAHVTILRKVEVAKLLVSSEVMFLTEYARGHTVLHRQLLASREFVNPDVIAFLIGLDAGILRVPCKYGDFPIHCAVRGTKGAGGVEAVVTCVELLLGDSTVHTYHPKVAVQHQGDIRLLRNGTGFTALRTAVQHSAPHEILTLLVDRNETVLYDRDDKTGFTPLHAFWERPSPIRSVPACIQVLRGKDQGVLLIKNSLGQIPLFHALASIRTTIFEWLVMLLPPLFPDRQAFVGTTSAETAQLHELARIRIGALKRAGALHLLPSQTLFLDNQGMTVIRAALLHDPGGRRTPPKIIAMLCAHFQDVIPCTYRDPLSSETDLMNALRSGWPAPLLSLLCDFDQHTLFLREKNVDTNNTPLHMYLQRIALTPREERCITVNALVDRHRLILQTQNPDMNTPLHLASMHHTAGGCMRVLLFSNYSEEHPDLYAQNIQAALVLQNMQGQTALHLALERFRSMDRDNQIVMWQDICKKLAGTTPEVRLKQDAHGNTPLHVAAYNCLLHTNNNNMSTRMRAVLIDEDREVLTRQNQHGKTALHIVVKMCDVFNFRHSLPFLIDDQENVLFRQDTQLQTPLHCCIRCHTRGAAYDIIQLLIGKSERALTLEDETGSFPLHAALEVGQGDMATLVSLLGKVNSTVISQKKNKAGLKPICLAIINLADIEVVKMLLGFAPLPHKRVEALLETTDGGKTLLHLALSQRAHLPTAELLVDCDKEVLRRLDSVGNTPLHVAVIFGVRASDVGFLIDAKCPNKMLLTANIFGQMPLHMAVSSTHCDYYEEWMQNIETLIDAERTILLKTLPDGMTALHLAIRYLPLHFTDLPNMHLIQSLACLIDMPQQRVLTMANKADGQTPLHLALCHIRHDAGMECVHFIKMLVDPAQVVLRGSGTVPEQNTPLALFQSRVSVMPGRTMQDPAVEAAIVNVLSGSAM